MQRSSRATKALNTAGNTTGKEDSENTYGYGTVKPRYSAFQGTGQNNTLYRGFFYCQHIDNYENTYWDQIPYTLLAELC